MTMAGAEGDALLPPPYAVSEKGQLRRLLQAGEKFSISVMGGPARIAKLKVTLQTLKAMGIDIVVCSKGLVGTIRKILRDCDLLKFFRHVYGNIGDCYGSCGPWDRESEVSWQLPADCYGLLGTMDCSYTGGKAAVIFELKRQQQLSRKQVYLVDDDENEIENARGTCSTFHVSGRCGLTEEFLDDIVAMCKRSS